MEGSHLPLTEFLIEALGETMDYDVLDLWKYDLLSYYFWATSVCVPN